MPKKITGLHKRDGSDHWWQRIMIPADLRQPFYGGKVNHRQSLHTSDRDEAEVMALALQAEFLEKFKRQRALLKPTPQVVVTDELAQLLADRVKATILKFDDVARYEPGALPYILKLFVPQPQRYFTADMPEPELKYADDAQTIMSPDMLKAFRDAHRFAVNDLGHQLTTGQLAYGQALANGEARRLGLAVDWTRNRMAVVRVLRSALEAWQIVAARDDGAHTESPNYPVTPPSITALAEPGVPNPHRPTTPKERDLWDVYTEWAKIKPANSQGKAQRALKLAEDAGACLVLSKLQWEDAVKTKEHVLKVKADVGEKTRHDVMVQLQALINFAVKSLHWIRENPWRGVNIPKGRRENHRE